MSSTGDAPVQPAIPPVRYYWEIRVRTDISGDLTRLWEVARKSKGGSAALAVTLLVLLALLTPVLMSALLGMVTLTVAGILTGLAQVVGHFVTLILAILLVLAGLGLMIRFIYQVVYESLFNRGQDSLTALRNRVQLRAALVSLFLLGPLAYCVYALAKLSPNGFVGDLKSDEQWRLFFLDSVLNGVFLNVPEKFLGRLS
jgi:hypothetical protein